MTPCKVRAAPIRGQRMTSRSSSNVKSLLSRARATIAWRAGAFAAKSARTPGSSLALTTKASSNCASPVRTSCEPKKLAMNWRAPCFVMWRPRELSAARPEEHRRHAGCGHRRRKLGGVVRVAHRDVDARVGHGERPARGERAEVIDDVGRRRRHAPQQLGRFGLQGGLQREPVVEERITGEDQGARTEDRLHHPRCEQVQPHEERWIDAREDVYIGRRPMGRHVLVIAADDLRENENLDVQPRGRDVEAPGHPLVQRRGGRCRRALRARQCCERHAALVSAGRLVEGKSECRRRIAPGSRILTAHGPILRGQRRRSTLDLRRRAGRRPEVSATGITASMRDVAPSWR